VSEGNGNGPDYTGAHLGLRDGPPSPHAIAVNLRTAAEAEGPPEGHKVLIWSTTALRIAELLEQAVAPGSFQDLLALHAPELLRRTATMAGVAEAQQLALCAAAVALEEIGAALGGP